MSVTLACDKTELLKARAPQIAAEDIGGLAPLPIMILVPSEGIPSPIMYLLVCHELSEAFIKLRRGNKVLLTKMQGQGDRCTHSEL